MQIVIELPDDLLKDTGGYKNFRFHGTEGVVEHITTDISREPYFTELNFFELPEHYGRLIDADAIKYRLNCMNGFICVSNAPSCAECPERAVTKAEIDEMPTIIPATESEVNNAADSD